MGMARLAILMIPTFLFTERNMNNQEKRKLAESILNYATRRNSLICILAQALLEALDEASPSKSSDAYSHPA